MWCPELSDVPVLKIHDPWNMPEPDLKKFGIGEKYPLPIACPKYTNLHQEQEEKKNEFKPKKKKWIKTTQNLIEILKTKVKILQFRERLETNLSFELKVKKFDY